ncbi:MAG TPA: hypothetical protein VIR45_03910 [Kiloniellaceae bacterium]
MLRILLHGFAAAFLFCLAAPPGDAAAQDGAGRGYVAGIPDLPLMPGLKELPDSGLVFDKPGGRIVEAFARGDVTAQAVIASTMAPCRSSAGGARRPAPTCAKASV